MSPQNVRVLIVEDDEDYYTLALDMLAASERMKFAVDWAPNYQAGLDALQGNERDVALVDYRLGTRNGLELIREARTLGCTTPIIMLTGLDDPALDDEALAAGAADYLVKVGLSEASLHRAIRYTLERKRAEERLRESELKFSSVTKSAHDGIIAADPQGRIISWNGGAEAIFGYRETEILGQPITTVLPEQWHAEYLDRIAPAATEAKFALPIEIYGLSQSGFEFPMELSVSGWRTPEGAFVSWIVRDVTQRKAAENLLTEERKLLRAVIDTIPDRIYVKDIEGRYVIDNEAHRRQFGAKGLEDVIGKNVYDFFKPSLAARFEADDKAVVRSGHPLLNLEEPRSDVMGNESWVLTSKVPLYNAQGKLVGVLGVSRDITERRRAEEERDASDHALRKAMAELLKSHDELKSTQLILIQTEKMESLGRLAAGVAHEVKNPLSQIMLAADFLTNSIPEADSTVSMVLDDIRQAVTRADTIVRGLLDFSAPSELSLRGQDLNAIIRQSLLLLKVELLGAHVEIETALGEGLPLVEVDQNKIEQVFINLCANAVHAMPKGGTLSVKTTTRQLTESERDEGAKVTDRLRAGDTVLVAEISDTGQGIPPGKLSVIFDPFFTTKPSGKGTGLGLTVSRKIVELHGGRLQIENRAEGGAKATVIFPAKTADSAENRDECAVPHLVNK